MVLSLLFENGSYIVTSPLLSLLHWPCFNSVHLGINQLLCLLIVTYRMIVYYALGGGKNTMGVRF